MAIKVKCKCGKAFGAPDNYGGKRVKCPGCGDPLTIPAGGESAGAGSSIKVTCECGKSVAVKAELAGKRIKCPGCGNPLAIPGKATRAAANAPQQSPAPAGASGVGDLLDEVDLSATNTGQRCPECRFDMGADDILCIQCGYRVDRGRKMETKRVVKPTGMSMSAGPSQGTSAPKAVQDLHGTLRTLGFLNLGLGILALLAWVAIFATAAVEIEIPAEVAGLVAVLFLILLPCISVCFSIYISAYFSMLQYIFVC